MVVVEPVVTEEKARVLLAEQAESEALDYKELLDLRENRDVVELTKDVGAMGALGGFIVIGADDHGRLTGLFSSELAALFDETKVRQALEKRLPRPVFVLTGRCVIDGNAVVVIYVAPQSEGITVFTKDGQYDEPTKAGPKTKTVFRAGDVFVRHGTSSERWHQEDIRRVLRRRDERTRERTRAELSSVIAAIQQGQQGQAIASGPLQAFTWQLDEATFDATAAAVVRSTDRAQLRLFLISLTGEAERLVEAGDTDGIRTLLDRATSLAGIAVTLDAPDVLDQTIRALLAIYRLGFDFPHHGPGAAAVPASTLWVEIVGRVEAIGGLAMRLEDWPTVRKLALQQPRPDDDYYPSWLRHGQVEGSRDGVFRTADGHEVAGVLVAVARNHAHRLEALRPDRPDDSAHDDALTSAPKPRDALLDSICAFDAIAGVATMAVSGKFHGGAFYPSFAGYYAHRVAPILARLATDAALRAALLPDVDVDNIRKAVGTLLHTAERVSSQQGRPFDLYDDRITAFIGSEPS